MEPGGVVPDLRGLVSALMVAAQRGIQIAMPNPVHCVLQITAESRNLAYKDQAWPQTR
ncbi:hypothetical protein ABH999_004053 [Bradyrhizobium yuanmingense]